MAVLTGAVSLPPQHFADLPDVAAFIRKGVKVKVRLKEGVEDALVQSIWDTALDGMRASPTKAEFVRREGEAAGLVVRWPLLGNVRVETTLAEVVESTLDSMHSERPLPADWHPYALSLAARLREEADRIEAATKPR